jgi:hypothetical protein
MLRVGFHQTVAEKGTVVLLLADWRSLRVIIDNYDRLVRQHMHYTEPVWEYTRMRILYQELL